MREPKQFQETRCVQPLAVCAWFKNFCEFNSAWLSNLFLIAVLNNTSKHIIYNNEQHVHKRHIYVAKHKRTCVHIPKLERRKHSEFSTYVATSYFLIIVLNNTSRHIV